MPEVSAWTGPRRSGGIVNLFDRLLGSTAAADRPLLRTPDGEVLSYGDLDRLSSRFAWVLHARGVRPGDRVAVQVEKTPEALALYLAVLRAGAVHLPLNTSYTEREVAYFLENASPKVFVCSTPRRSEYSNDDPDVDKASPAPVTGQPRVQFLTLGGDGDGGLLRESRTQPDRFPTVGRSPSDLAAIVYTSGTTGRPKGAMLTHQNLLANGEVLREAWRFTEQDVLLHALPIYHVHGLFVAIHTVMLSGASLLWLPKFDADVVVNLLPESTVFMGVPTYYSRLLSHPDLRPELVHGMRLFTSGSAPLSPEIHREFSRCTRHDILERYGMTETGMITSNPYCGERIPGTVGPPLRGVSVRIADPESGAELADGEVGSIEVRGENVFTGYWKMPEVSRSEFREDGFFITGDMGRIDERGYVSILGRGKDLVISGGLNVYPKEVEDAIDALPGVAESAVIGVPHPDFGEAVVAVVVPAASGPTASDSAVQMPTGRATSKQSKTPSESLVPTESRSPSESLVPTESRSPNASQTVAGKGIVDALRADLAAFKLPKAVVFLDELPRNSMGKVQKNLLRDSYRDLFVG